MYNCIINVYGQYLEYDIFDFMQTTTTHTGFYLVIVKGTVITDIS